MRPVILQPGEGERLEYARGTRLVIKAVAETTGTAFSMSEVTLPPQTPGPPKHVHRRLTDSFYVLDGVLHLYVGEDEVDLCAGGYALVPPNTKHTFANTSEQPVRFLNINAPGGWENYLRDLAAAAKRSGGLPTPAEFATLMKNYDLEVTPKRILKIDSRLEWLVVASILALFALALALGWINIDWPRPL